MISSYLPAQNYSFWTASKWILRVMNAGVAESKINVFLDSL
jgi:hypothetical protein